MTVTHKYILILIVSLGILCLLILSVIQHEKKIDKYNILIYQDRHRYRTDKVETTPEGIKFIDHEGKNVYISGKYIIEEK